MVKCYACKLLQELFHNTKGTNRDYWVMTELFVMLHKNKDYCDKTTYTDRKLYYLDEIK